MKIRVLLAMVAVVSLTAITIDFSNLPNYANQVVPDYVFEDNTDGNDITDEGAMLGRVLFYDKNLSANNTVACANCHKQEYAFGDTAIQSVGLAGGLTKRHSMRLINARFGAEDQFFWDERAATLEDQTTMPIQDHVEMGYSGNNGDQTILDLIEKLEQIDYYNHLFYAAFGDTSITEERMQLALAQFIRSIQSFDSKFDEGFDSVGGQIQTDFPNYTTQENLGKLLFTTPPPIGGAGCARCHRWPEFSIQQNVDNNGVIGVAGEPTEIDLTNTRAPSLRDVVNANGEPNGPFMHDGSMATLMDVINHYDSIPDLAVNTNLDHRLNMMGNTQVLNLTAEEKDALVAFLETLTGTDVYTNEKWSSPFDENGNLVIMNSTLGSEEIEAAALVQVYPNPANNQIFIKADVGISEISILAADGQIIHSDVSTPFCASIDIENLHSGLYYLRIAPINGTKVYLRPIVKM